MKKTRKLNQNYKGQLRSFKTSETRRNNKKRLIEYKGGKCERCGYNKSIPAVYDFHHLDPNTKDFGLSYKGSTRSFDKLKIEVDKCILLCKNCHAEIHAAIDAIKIQEQLKRFVI